jgi:hypothetical protein
MALLSLLAGQVALCVGLEAASLLLAAACSLYAAAKLR